MPETEVLQRKKRVRGGHRSSATRTLGQVANSLEESPVDAKRLTVLKLSLEEKLKTLKELNADIIELVPEDDLEPS